MFDQRDLYINQILNHYRKPNLADTEYYTVNYTYSDNHSFCRMISHNEGLDIVYNYIKQLQDKIEEYKHIERIIQAARKEDNYDS